MTKTYFIQTCPTCGRSLHIQVQYLGKTLSCQHCHGKLTATGRDTPSDSLAILDRANALLNQTKIA